MTIIYQPTKKEIKLRKDVWEMLKSKDTVTNTEIRNKFKVGYPLATRTIDFFERLGVLIQSSKQYIINHEYKEIIDFYESTTLSTSTN